MCWLVAASVHRELKIQELALAKHIKLKWVASSSAVVWQSGRWESCLDKRAFTLQFTPRPLWSYFIYSNMVALCLRLPVYRLGLVWGEWGTGVAKLKNVPGPWEWAPPCALGSLLHHLSPGRGHSTPREVVEASVPASRSWLFHWYEHRAWTHGWYRQEERKSSSGPVQDLWGQGSWGSAILRNSLNSLHQNRGEGWSSSCGLLLSGAPLA